MNNESIAKTVNAEIQLRLRAFGNMQSSFNVYADADFLSKNPSLVLKAHEAYTGSKVAADYLFGFRKFCKEQDYNEYETGRYLFNQCFTKGFNSLYANPPECAAMAIYLALRKNHNTLDQVSRALVIDHHYKQHLTKVLHQFAVVGEVPAKNEDIRLPFRKVGTFLHSSLPTRIDQPWAIDATFNLACPLSEYPTLLGNAVSLMTKEDSVFEKVRPPIATVMGWSEKNIRVLGSATEKKLKDRYQIANSMQPMAFYNSVFNAELLLMLVTQRSMRLDISENDGAIGSSTLF